MIYILTASEPASDRVTVAASTDAGKLMRKAGYLLIDQIGATMARDQPLVWMDDQDCPNMAWRAYNETGHVEYRVEEAMQL